MTERKLGRMIALVVIIGFLGFGLLLLLKPTKVGSTTAKTISSPDTIGRSVRIYYELGEERGSIYFTVLNHWNYDKIVFRDGDFDGVLDDVHIFRQNDSLQFTKEALKSKGFIEGLPFILICDLENWETWESRYLEVRKEVEEGKR